MDRKDKELRGYANMVPLIGIYNYTVILTYLSLISAVLGMVFSSQGSFTAAIVCLAVSGFCDAFDGTVARSKKDRTETEKAFGIQIDSLCDAVSFGVYPAVLCYHMGMNGFFGIVIMAIYILCAVIRLAYFNVLEEQRQKAEDGCNKVYRGLPVTSISMILPVFCLLRSVCPASLFTAALHLLMACVSLLFVLDFPVKKPCFDRFFARNE